jgi:hypothetical protein
MIVDVVVRERNVERILARDKIRWDKISSVMYFSSIIFDGIHLVHFGRVTPQSLATTVSAFIAGRVAPA